MPRFYITAEYSADIWLRALLIRGQQLSVLKEGIIQFPIVFVGDTEYYVDCVSTSLSGCAFRCPEVLEKENTMGRWHTMPLHKAKDYLLAMDPTFDIEIFQLQQELKDG